MINSDKIRDEVRERYGRDAESNSSCCSSSCCSTDSDQSEAVYSIGLGYSEDDVSSVPDGANMGLGCGNPQAIASIKKGEIVLDLGSGGGFDVFLAS